MTESTPGPLRVQTLTDETHRRALFARGYLLTTRDLEAGAEFPFFGNWARVRLGSWNLYTHCLTKHYCHSVNDVRILLVGHAYNPFTGQSDEEALLMTAAEALAESEQAFHATMSEWTGRFIVVVIRGEELLAVQDCAGMRTLFYGQVQGAPYLTSHAQLLSDLCGLEMTPWIRELVDSREYKVGIRFLPGDVSPFTEVKRLGPNTALTYREGRFGVHRFYSPSTTAEGGTEEEQAARIARIAEILKASLDITSRKWGSPAISLTGGTDSQTTLAASVDSRARLKFFTFASNDEEAHDLRAAQDLAAHLGLDHSAYLVPQSEEAIPGYQEFAAVVQHNAAYVRANAANDLRKMAFFASDPPCEVDVKSWVSEVARSNFSKRLGMEKLPSPLSPRQMTILYKRIFFDRKLLRRVDSAFADWMQRVGFGGIEGVDDADMVYWEHRFPAWGGTVLSEFDMCWETTVPFNNRRLIEMMLGFPKHRRIDDYAHREVVKRLDPQLANRNVHVVNYSKQKLRVVVERLFFEINSRLP